MEEEKGQPIFEEEEEEEDDAFIDPFFDSYSIVVPKHEKRRRTESLELGGRRSGMIDPEMNDQTVNDFKIQSSKEEEMLQTLSSEKNKFYYVFVILFFCENRTSYQRTQFHW